MYGILRARVLTKLSSNQSKLFTANVRLYCNHIKPETVTSCGDGPSREDVKKLETVDCSGKDGIDNGRSSDKDMSWVEKLVYSSYLEKHLPTSSYKFARSERAELKETDRKEWLAKSGALPPVALKYLMEEEETEKRNPTEESSKEAVQFPYKIFSNTEFKEDMASRPLTHGENPEEELNGKSATQYGGYDEGKLPPKMVSVADKLKKQEVNIQSIVEETPDDQDLFETAVEVCMGSTGTPDPSIPSSRVPCGGCGAFLHCQDQSIPGYISSEVFKGSRERDLRAELCYRCSVLETQQATLNVNVSPADYPRIVDRIRDKFAMILLLVDLTDFPCSIWPGILDIVGNRRPIFLVGNKVDMIPQDSPEYLQRLEESMVKCAVEVGMLEANIMHTALISARTGFGVEDLISTIYNVWNGKGDIFIMGCTNVGKSSLFNIFLNSDLCQPQVYDMVQKATISQWPGTTLNLLKFPMAEPFGWRNALRQKRLKTESPILKAEQKEREIEFEMTKNPELVTLTGHVGKTFVNQPKLDEMDHLVSLKDIFQINPHSTNAPIIQKPGQWNPKHPKFDKSRWVYDTPGAVNSNQILDLLTLPELVQSLPKTLIQPRTYFIKPQMTLFIGGLVRIDHVEGEHPIRYTIFSNTALPVTMALLNDADEVYKQGLGSRVFGVPSGNKERLEQFPELSSRHIDLVGTGHNYSVTDIVLSSIGWIAVTAGHKKTFSLLVHTPNGRGIFFRQPALLPYAVNWKGKRIRGTYSYLPHKVYVPHKADSYRIKRPQRQSPYLLRNDMENQNY